MFTKPRQTGDDSLLKTRLNWFPFPFAKNSQLIRYNDFAVLNYAPLTAVRLSQTRTKKGFCQGIKVLKCISLSALHGAAYFFIENPAKIYFKSRKQIASFLIS